MESSIVWEDKVWESSGQAMNKTVAGKCDHADTRLACIECSSPICSNCLVECAVGFRCKSCVAPVKSAATPPSGPMLVARTLGLFVAVGFAAGWIMPMIRVPFFSCVIC